MCVCVCVVCVMYLHISLIAKRLKLVTIKFIYVLVFAEEKKAKCYNTLANLVCSERQQSNSSAYMM